MKKCYSRFHFHVLDYCQWLRIPDELSIPRMPRKQFELGDITSTSGNFRSYQIQRANIHFKLPNHYCVLRRVELWKRLSWIIAHAMPMPAALRVESTLACKAACSQLLRINLVLFFKKWLCQGSNLHHWDP